MHTHKRISDPGSLCASSRARPCDVTRQLRGPPKNDCHDGDAPLRSAAPRLPSRHPTETPASPRHSRTASPSVRQLFAAPDSSAPVASNVSSYDGPNSMVRSRGRLGIAHGLFIVPHRTQYQRRPAGCSNTHACDAVRAGTGQGCSVTHRIGFRSSGLTAAASNREGPR